MPKYRVKTGKSFGPGGRYPAGTILELTEAEARGVEDKLERVEDTALPGSTREIVPDEPIQFRNDLGVEVPPDLKLMLDEEPEEFHLEEKAEPEEKPAPKPKAARKTTTHRKKDTEG